MEQTRILIADDHPVYRHGLVTLLEGNARYRVVADTGDGESAIQLLAQMKPDIAVLDVAMPKLSGLDVVRLANEYNLQVEFVVLTMYREEEYFSAAMDLGVKGYVLKESALTDLLSCLDAVADGRFYVSPLVSGYLLKRTGHLKTMDRRQPALVELTPMERRVLKLIADNKTSKEIADDLGISYRTVQNHRTNMCLKLGLQGYNKLLQFALEHRSGL